MDDKRLTLDEVLKRARSGGFECDNHLGPFLTYLKSWHDATERYKAEKHSHPVEDDDTDEFDDDHPAELWRYMLLWPNPFLPGPRG